MLMWLLLGFGAAVVFAIVVIRNAENDDKRRTRKK